MPVELRTEAYLPDQCEPMSELLKSHFNETDRLLTASYTRWLYEENPFGRAVLIRCVDGDRWVGLTALIPVRLRASGAASDAFYAVNVLVHPRYQGQRLFSRMITAAKELTASHGVPLMGHPNAAAYGPWQRAKMLFHDELRPGIAVPMPFQPLRAEPITRTTQLAPAEAVLQQVVSSAPSWRVDAGPDYLAWRYLRHPSNKYVLQLLSAGGQIAGVQVARRLKPGAHLLVEQMVLRGYAAAALGRLPVATICFLPDALHAECGLRLLRLPWKKRIPVFFTPGASPLPPSGIAQLGLSPSDF